MNIEDLFEGTPLRGVLTISSTMYPSITVKSKKSCNVKVMFNPPATILWIGDKKFISKAHAEDFDEEKGLLMCLAKANGISHSDLKRMMKQAVRPMDKKNTKQGEPNG